MSLGALTLFQNLVSQREWWRRAIVSRFQCFRTFDTLVLIQRNGRKHTYDRLSFYAIPAEKRSCWQPVASFQLVWREKNLKFHYLVNLYTLGCLPRVPKVYRSAVNRACWNACITWDSSHITLG